MPSIYMNILYVYLTFLSLRVTGKKRKKNQNKTSNFDLLFIVEYISVCFISHVRLAIHVGQSVIKWNFKVCV
jgi:hypothetical protein